MTHELFRGNLSPYDAAGGQTEMLSPVERTDKFFNQDVHELAQALEGKEVIEDSSGIRVLLTEVEAWEKVTVGKRYQDMNEKNMRQGDLFAFYFPLRRMTQSLVIARDEDGIGACVRVKRASKFDRDKQVFVLMEREGDLAKSFDLGQQQKSEVKTLAFVDDSDVLHLVGESRRVGVTSDSRIDPEQANQALTDLINGEK